MCHIFPWKEIWYLIAKDWLKFGKNVHSQLVRPTVYNIVSKIEVASDWYTCISKLREVVFFFVRFSFTVFRKNFAPFYFALFALSPEDEFKTVRIEFCERIMEKNRRGANSRLGESVPDLYSAKIRLGKFKAVYSSIEFSFGFICKRILLQNSQNICTYLIHVSDINLITYIE